MMFIAVAPLGAKLIVMCLTVHPVDDTMTDVFWSVAVKGTGLI